MHRVPILLRIQLWVKCVSFAEKLHLLVDMHSPSTRFWGQNAPFVVPDRAELQCGAKTDRGAYTFKAEGDGQFPHPRERQSLMTGLRSGNSFSNLPS